MRTLVANTVDRQARRGWFAETLVVLGILAFAYFAVTLQPQRSEPAPAVPSVFSIG
jgi:hypothetical protein